MKMKKETRSRLLRQNYKNSSNFPVSMAKKPKFPLANVGSCSTIYEETYLPT